MCAPVSVCHQVSTIGAGDSFRAPGVTEPSSCRVPAPLLPPITSRYHIQASGLMASPTVPSTRREERSKESGMDRPHFMQVRMAVGAV